MDQGYRSIDHGASISQFQATMKALELACGSIQMNESPASAEATISLLTRSPRPYQACQYILENSQVSNARFLAAGAIRDAAIREWGLLTANEQKSLISFCLCYVMQHANSPEGYVQAKVASVAAQLLKRGWLDFAASDKEYILIQVKQAVTGKNSVDVQFAGINFLESLVSEFSSSTATVLGLPREFHDQCSTSLEQDFLKTFYSWAQDAAVSVANTIIMSNGSVPEAKVCAAALRFMLQVLNWDFRCNKNPSAGGKGGIYVFCDRVCDESYSTRKNESNLSQPGPLWRDVLITSGHVGWILNLYGALRQKISLQGYWLDCPLAVSARNLIVQFCALTGTIFPSDNRQLQVQHIVQILSGIIEWIDPPQDVSKAIQNGRSESELLDGCRALLSIATVMSPTVFDQLLKSVRPYGTVNLLSTLTCEVIKHLMENYSEVETWSWVARDILLDTWTVLLMPMDTINCDLLLPPEGISAAANLFALIVEFELKVAAASAYDDDNEYDYLQASVLAMDERLSSYALIARAAIDLTVPLLARLLSERFLKLHQGRNMSDPTTTLEEIYSLLLLTGHVLADEGLGETPLIPNAVQNCFLDVVEPENHPVIVLSGSIIKFSEQSLDAGMRSSFFSSRLMEAVVWFLARWSATYLMPPKDDQGNNSTKEEHKEAQLKCENSKKLLLKVFDEQNQGKVVLDIIVHIATSTLISYAGEKDLQGLTCLQLLHGLAQRRDLCKHLVTLESWHKLANAFAIDGTLLSLDGTHQRSLAQTLALSASNLSNRDESRLFIRNLTNHMTTYLLDLSGRNDLKRISQQPDIILVLSCLLERLRGVATTASEPRLQKAIYEMGFSILNPILILFDVYKNESAVVYRLLKFVVDWLDVQISHLEEAHEAVVVVDFCMRLLQIYSSHNIGRISVGISSRLKSEADTEKYKDLRALLQLLALVCNENFVSISTEAMKANGTNISKVISAGLHFVTPLMTAEMLKYPKLCKDYFYLISHVLSWNPEMVTHMNSQAFVNMIGSLDFGLKNQAPEIVDHSLNALRALASYHYKETGAGKFGLGTYATGFRDAEGNNQEGIFSRFLPSLLQYLLFEDYSSDFVSSAADALFALILCEQNLYQRLRNELVGKQENPTVKLRLANAFQVLATSNNITPTIDPNNFKKFRKNLWNFLIDVRGFLRTK